MNNKFEFFDNLKLEQDKVFSLFASMGVIVRTPSQFNVFRPQEGKYRGENSIKYEFNNALTDVRGKSATFLVKDVPINAYGGNSFFLIYDPNKIDVLLAAKSDASIQGSWSEELIFTGEKPKLRGNGDTDYSRHKNQKGGTSGIRQKLLKMEEKRRKKSPTSKGNRYVGLACFAHNELLVVAKEKSSVGNAIIGIGIHKKCLSRFLFSELSTIKTVSQNLSFYVYDPTEGFKKLSREVIENPERIFSHLFKNFIYCEVELKDQFFTLRRYQEPSVLDELKWKALKVILSSCEIKDRRNFYKFRISELENEAKEIHLSLFSYEDLDGLIKQLEDLNAANSEEQIASIEYKAVAFVYLKWLFNTEGESKYSGYGCYNTEKSNNFSHIKLKRNINDHGLPIFEFCDKISFRGKILTLLVKVGLVDGKVKVFGCINEIFYSYGSRDIVVLPLGLGGLDGDGGAIYALESAWNIQSTKVAQVENMDSINTASALNAKNSTANVFEKVSVEGKQNFNSPHESSAEPIFIDFDRPVYLALAEVVKLKIDRDGFSKFYPDSCFDSTYDGNGFLLTRRRLPSLSDKADEKTKAENTKISLMESFFNNTVSNKKSIFIDFDQPVFFTPGEVAKLEIDGDGFSKLYPDSYFEFKYKEDTDGYLLTRRRWYVLSNKVSLPFLNKTGFLEIDNFPQFLKLKERNATFPPMYSIEKFPEEDHIETGNMGQVHLVSGENTRFSLKFDRLIHSEVKQGRKFTLNPHKVHSYCILVQPLSPIDMHRSFKICYRKWKVTKDIPQSNYIAGIKGLAFVKELNQWGVLYEYVDGYHFDIFCSDLKSEEHSLKYSKIVNICLQLVEGLKILNDAGHPHTDLLEPNILIRKANHTPALIDYDSSRHAKNNSIFSKESRQQFGVRLSQLVKMLDSDFSDLNQLAEDCKSEKTFEEFHWEMILDRLKSFKKLSHESLPSDSAETVPHNATFYLLKM